MKVLVSRTRASADETEMHDLGDASEVYLPSKPMDKDQILMPDLSTYDMLHTMSVQWPFLSFDIIKDQLGDERRNVKLPPPYVLRLLMLEYPQTMYLVAGTQADQQQNNEIQIMKLSQLHRTRKSRYTEQDEDSNSDSDDDDNDVDEDPVLEHRAIPTDCGTNRLRVHQSLHSLVAASWSERGKVHIWNLQPSYNSLSTPGSESDRKERPLYTVKQHRDEGYGLAFSSDGALLSGDNQGKIFLTQPTSSHYTTSPQSFSSHSPQSVEDIQWSPSEKSVFASVSSSGALHIHDTRTPARNKPAIHVTASQVDVNVLSWNTAVTYLLVTGDDNGATKVWDLRQLKESGGKDATVAEFAWHKAAVTSIEWCPSESSVFASSGADEQVCLWDLSTEADDEELPASADLRDIPNQLLFIHQAQATSLG